MQTTRYGCAECLASWTDGPTRCPECSSGEVFVDRHPGEAHDLYDRTLSILASNGAAALSLAFHAEAVTASTTTRTMSGTLVRYGVPGRTSRGRLKVAPGALRFPDDLTRVKLTREHDRAASRGHAIAVEHTNDGIRASVRASDGPEGDAALTEATDGTRDAFSFDVVDATIAGDTITDALVIAIGQVGIPAYDDARIDSIAASTTTQETQMTKEQRARLAWLRALDTRTAEQEADLAQLVALEAANPEPQAENQPPPAPAAPAAPATGTDQVAASIPAAPGSYPVAPSGVQVTREPGAALLAFYEAITASFAPGNVNKFADITAALSDITNTANPSIAAPAWSGELWSGLLYEPIWLDLFNSGDLTSWTGTGWRFTKKLAIQDYAGDKAAIPSDTITTQSQTYTAARMAVGVDVDRKFFDFPDTGFIASLFEQVRESWTIQLDSKVRADALTAAIGTRNITVGITNASPTVTGLPGTFSSEDVGATIVGTGIPASTTITAVAAGGGSATMSANATATNAALAATITLQSTSLLKAAGKGMAAIKRNTRAKGTFVVVNDDDLMDLLDITNNTVPAFLDMFNIKPENLRGDSAVPVGTVVVGAKPAKTVRTLPGSPVRVDAQDLAKGGVDEAFFGYWAIETHHSGGIVKVTYKNP